MTWNLEPILLLSIKGLPMKLIYIYRHNDYAAITAAYLRLKVQPAKPVRLKEMKLYFLGTDQKLNEVYLLRYTIKKHILMNLLEGLSEMFKDELAVIDLSLYDQWHIRLLTRLRPKATLKIMEGNKHEGSL